jgi:excinuclease ABC subunit A
MVSTECPLCHGKRLCRESLSVKFAGFDIADICRLPLARLDDLLRPYAKTTAPSIARLAAEHPEKAVTVQRIAQDLCDRLTVLLDLGLGYLSLERSTPALSPGELQRLRLATQVRANRTPRSPKGWLRLRGATRNNLHGLDVDFPLGVFTTVPAFRARASRAW